MFQTLFRRRRDHRPRALYEAAVDQARQPDFYRILGVADTLDGRFDMLVLHLSAVIDRFRNPDRSIDHDGQALFDLFVTDMDHNLRQMGVGDLSVPKKMQKIGQSFYGRFGAYTHAADRAALAAAIERNVFAGSDAEEAPRPAAGVLADYFAAARAAIAGADRADLLAGKVPWPPVPDLNARGDDDDLSDQPAAAGR